MNDTTAAGPPASAAVPWQQTWFEPVARRRMRAWRGVEAQHIVATMRLVDSLEEQELLERLLEKSKPALPKGGAKHYLLTTPFRYRPALGSRFRRPGALGVWYGAETVRTACAEVAYWRWRFLSDSEGLAAADLLTEHTLFCATVDGGAIDLLSTPWAGQRTRWMHPTDYGATQALADAAAAESVQWIRYESARDPAGICCAVLDVAALDELDLAGQQTWHCRATREAVRMVHGDERFEWRYG